jgi:hypothetical protein
MSLPISTSQVAGITGVSHHTARAMAPWCTPSGKLTFYPKGKHVPY